MAKPVIAVTVAPGPDVAGAAAPPGKRLLRLEVRNAQTPIERKPPWIKVRARMGPEYTQLKNLVRREGLHTVIKRRTNVPW